MSSGEKIEDAYLIWSNQHRAWWRPDSAGYTNHAQAAGIYNFDQAKSICWFGRDGWRTDAPPDEIMVPLEGIPEKFRPALVPQKAQS